VSISSFITDFNVSSGIVIKDNSGASVSGSVSDISSNTLQINRNSNTDKFFKIYSGEGFDPLSSQSLSCQGMTENLDYSVGVVNRDNYIFESRIISVINSYSNYSFLKKDLSVPRGSETEISFEFSNGTRIGTGNQTPTTNIFVDEKPVEYVSLNGDIVPGKIITKVW